MPKVRAAYREARRRQILDAANACFARQGFHQTSVQDICQEAGLSAGAVYRYFPGKEHIIAASCLDCQQGIIDFITAAKEQGNPPLQTLDFIIEHGLNMLGGDAFREPTMMNVQVWSEAMRSEEVRKALLATTFNTLGEAFTDLFQQAKDDGKVDSTLSPRGLAITVMAMFHGLVLHKSLDEDIDIAAGGRAMRALYQGTFRIPEEPA